MMWMMLTMMIMIMTMVMTMMVIMMRFINTGPMFGGKSTRVKIRLKTPPLASTLN